ncbi:MAG: ABC transporter substrate-binding protein [Solirubrobacteraceae bacterium]
MGKLRIATHGRLQDWIAVQNGYFEKEGLDYELDVRAQENIQQEIVADGGGEIRTGAYELYRSGSGGKQHMSCACHWAVNQAASDSAGRMWGHAYAVLPSGVYVSGDSMLREAADLAGVPVAVGYHSGSHFSTVQALEAVIDPAQIELRFGGMPYDRVDALLAGDVQAAAVWGAATYLVEQQGFVKLLDTTFMAAFMFEQAIDPEDVKRYMNGLRRAQMELDLQPEPYKHHYLNEIPERFHALIDVRRFGPGERIAFLPYTADAFERAQRWMRERALFEDSGEAPAAYASVVQV